MARFRVSNRAIEDLRAIGRYTQERWGEEQRRKYLDGLDDAFQSLSEFPRMAPEREDFDPPIRIHHHEKHLIIYSVEEDRVLIVRILHQSMDVPAQLSNG